jgi:IS30 family transposase
MAQIGRPGMSGQQKAELWRRWREGESLSDISRALAKNPGSIHGVLASSGGLAPQERRRSARALTRGQREEISRGLVTGLTLRGISAGVGVSPSTITREVHRNGGRIRYRAERAEERALKLGLRPKLCRLATRPRVCRLVAAKLAKNWSPEQIAGWLRRTFPGEEAMHISHETIYRSLFIQARGVLKRELIGHLRSGRMMRCGKTSTSRHGRSSISDAVSISDRPAEVEERAVPGHWEGDLVSGSSNTHIATLVERRSRFLVLVRVKGKDTSTVVNAIVRQVKHLPTGVMTSLTWDRGAELAAHKLFSIATNAKVYFCNPSSPWQRGTNENTNGLVRQYFPRRTDLSAYSQRDLNKVACEMNKRPRKTLGYMSPAESFAERIALTG